MNIYAVVSEQIDPGISIYDMEPADIYCIAALVRARSRSQARYLAARADGGWAVMPWDGVRYAVRLLQRDVPGEPAVVSDDPEYQELWNDPRWPDPPNMPPLPGQIVCSWCGTLIRYDETLPDGETSHGICLACAAEWAKDAGLADGRG